MGLDLLTLSSHTFHAKQTLDVNIFKLFKLAFMKHRIFWTLRNKGKGVAKEDLAQWVSLAYKITMTPENIKKRFSTTGIWPLNMEVMNGKMGPSEAFVNVMDGNFHEPSFDIHVEEVIGDKLMRTQEGHTLYVVALMKDREWIQHSTCYHDGTCGNVPKN